MASKFVNGKITLFDDDLEMDTNNYYWDVTSKNYIRFKPKGKYGGPWVRFHRWIMGLEKGDVRQIDHINRNPLDNRRENLRITDYYGNAANRSSIYKRSGAFAKLGVRGGAKYIGFNKQKEKFYLAVWRAKKVYWGGYYQTIDEAAAARFVFLQKLKEKGLEV